MIRATLLLLTGLLLLPGCKVILSASDGGRVAARSGAGCAGGETCAVASGSSGFSNTFTGVPEPGFRFVGWQQGHGLLCGGSTQACALEGIPLDLAAQATELPLAAVFAPQALRDHSVRTTFGTFYEFIAMARDLSSQFSVQTGLPVFHDANNGERSEQCHRGDGRQVIRVRQGGRLLKANFRQCRVDEDTWVDGEMIVSYEQIVDTWDFQLAVTFNDYRVYSADSSIVSNGEIRYTQDSQEPWHRARVELVAVDSSGDYRAARGLAFDLHHARSWTPTLYRNVSGAVGYRAQPDIPVRSSGDDAAVSLAPAGEAPLRVTFGRRQLTLHREDPALPYPVSVRLPYAELDSGRMDYQAGTNLPPYPVSDLDDTDALEAWYGMESSEYVQGQAAELDLQGLLSDRNADPLQYHLAVKSIAPGVAANGALLPGSRPLGHDRITRLDASRFRFLPGQAGAYLLSISASDGESVASSDVELRLLVLADYDGDGIADGHDSDDDNDGVADGDDAFPFDPGETLDTDGDGVGNNADTDDDGDGVPDTSDAAPLSSFCALPQEAGPNGCYFEDGQRRFFIDDGGILYWYAPGHNDIARWDIDAGRFLPALQLHGAGEGDTLTAAAYSPSHRRIYAGFQSGTVTRLDPFASPSSESGAEASLARTENPVSLLRAAGHYLIAAARVREHLGHTLRIEGQALVFDDLGLRHDVEESWGLWSTHDYQVDSTSSQLYDAFANKQDLDLASGALIPEQGKFHSPPLAASPDRALTLRSDGRVYDVSTFEPLYELLPLYPAPDARRLAWRDDGLWVLKSSGPRGAWIERYRNDGLLLEERTLPGDHGGFLLRHGEDLIAISQKAFKGGDTPGTLVDGRFYITRIRPAADG